MSNLIVHGVDPRCFVAGKLTPPPPLPFLSRRALSKVKDRLDIPTICSYCKAPVVLVRNSEIYGGRDYGDWPYAYLCRKCGAHVGLHAKTDIPLGTLADTGTREARRRGKERFLKLLRRNFSGDRRLAYEWLAKQMNIETKQCHFGMFTIAQCNQTEEIISQALDAGSNT